MGAYICQVKDVNKTIILEKEISKNFNLGNIEIYSCKVLCSLSLKERVF